MVTRGSFRVSSYLPIGNNFSMGNGVYVIARATNSGNPLNKYQVRRSQLGYHYLELSMSWCSSNMDIHTAGF